MKEKRIHKRHEANLPVKLEVVTSFKTKVFDLETKDISFTGAFIYTKDASFIPDDTRFNIDLTIPENGNKDLAELKSLMTCEGSMVRYNSEGMAVIFDGGCHTMNLRDSKMS